MSYRSRACTLLGLVISSTLIPAEPHAVTSTPLRSPASLAELCRMSMINTISSPDGLAEYTQHPERLDQLNIPEHEQVQLKKRIIAKKASAWHWNHLTLHARTIYKKIVRINGLGFNLDGTRVGLGCCAGNIYLIDLNSNTERLYHNVHIHDTNDIMFDEHTNSIVSTADYKTISRTNLSDGVTTTIKSGNRHLWNRPGRIGTNRIVSANTDTQCVEIIDSATLQVVQTIHCGKKIVQASAAPSGNYIATLSYTGNKQANSLPEEIVELYEVSTGNRIGTSYTSDGYPPRMIIFNPAHDRQLALVCVDRVIMIDPWDAQEQICITSKLNIHDLDFSPDGSLIALGLDRGIFDLRSSADGRLISSWKADCSFIHKIRFSPDGKQLLVSQDNAQVVLASLSNDQLTLAQLLALMAQDQVNQSKH